MASRIEAWSVRPDEPLVPRPRLERALSDATGIAVLSGPHQSGRTSLLRSWLAARDPAGRAVVWVDASVRLLDPDALWSRLAGRGPDDAEPDDRVSDAADRLRDRGVGVLVLDDADVYLADAHIAGLARLVERAPELAVLAVSRAPGLGEAVVVTASDLAATPDELALIAAGHGLEAHPLLLDAVSATFEGWIGPSLAALRFAADAPPAADPVATGRNAIGTGLALVARAFAETRGDSPLVDYWCWRMAEELTAESAAVVFGDGAAARLARLEAEGLVAPAADPTSADPTPTTPAEGLPRWRARLGPALEAALDEALTAKLPGVRRDVHDALSRSSFADGDIVAGVRHVIASGDGERLAAVLDEHFADLMNASKQTLGEAIAALPAEVLEREPRWAAARQYVGYIPAAGEVRPVQYRHADAADGGSLLDHLAGATSRMAGARFAGRFEEAARTASDLPGTVAEAAPARLAEIERALPDLRLQWAISLLLAGHAGPALAEYRQAYDLALAAGNTRIAVESAGTIALIRAFTGDPDEAEAWVARIPPYEDPADTVHAAGALARARLALDRLEEDEARSILDGLTPAMLPELWAVATALRASADALWADPGAGLVAFEAELAARPAEQSREGLNRDLLAAARSELLVAAGRLAAAERALEPGPSTAFGALFDEVARTRVALLCGDREALGRTISASEAADSGWIRAAAEFFVARAVDALASGEPADRWRAPLASALALILPRGLYSVLARAPRAESERLGIAGAVPAGVVPLLARTAAVPSPERPVALSRSEREVLAALAEGRSSAQIADARFVSRNTVKTQLRSIYRKLGTSSQAETVRLARARPDLFRAE